MLKQQNKQNTPHKSQQLLLKNNWKYHNKRNKSKIKKFE